MTPPADPPVLPAEPIDEQGEDWWIHAEILGDTDLDPTTRQT